MSELNCQKCGACCLDQLVVLMPGDNVPFHMSLDQSCVSVKYGEGLPGGMTPLDHCVGLVMRNQFGRCVALEGKVGVQVSCSIYKTRPAVCRAMKKGDWACLTVRERTQELQRQKPPGGDSEDSPKRAAGDRSRAEDTGSGTRRNQRPDRS